MNSSIHGVIQYLTLKNTFSTNEKEIAPFVMEFVSSPIGMCFFRIKILNRYLTAGNTFYLDEAKSDSNLFYMHGSSGTIHTIFGKCFDMENNSLVLKNSEDHTFGFGPLYTSFSFGMPKTPIATLFTKGIVVLDKNLQDLHDFKHCSNIVHTSSKKRMSRFKEPCFQSLLEHPSITSFVNKIYESTPYHLTTYSSNKVRKGLSEPGWHVDYPYHTYTGQYPEETHGLQILILLDDFTEENGATEYIPSSHLYREFPTTEKVAKHTSARLVAPKGSVVVWLAKLWHSEGVSHVEQDRCALLANMSPTFVPPKNKRVQ
jgi:hypothetical protein